MKFLVDWFNIHSEVDFSLNNSLFNLHIGTFPNLKPVINISSTCYILNFHENINHFMNDIFFPFYILYSKNKKKVLFMGGRNQFLVDFLTPLIDPKDLIIADLNYYYTFPEIIIPDEGRLITVFDNYENILIDIREKIFSYYKIEVNRTKNILYGRTDLQRKNLLKIDYNFLEKNNIFLVELANISFYELLKILSRVRRFIYVLGAGTFYFLFFDKDTAVLEISPHQDRSWARFGLGSMCPYKTFVSHNIEPSEFAAMTDPLDDAHVYFDEAIKDEILAMLD